MHKVQAAEPTAALVEAFGIKGRLQLNLDSVIAPVVVVGDVRASDIQGTGYVDSFFEAALALESAVLRLQGNANFDLVPKWVRVRTVTAEPFNIRLNTSGVSSVLTGAGNLEGADRWNPTRPGAPNTRPSVGTFAGAVTGNLRERFRCLAGEDRQIDLTGWRLTAGSELNIQCETLNVGVIWTLCWDVEPTS